jgi:XRE family aerobic/anaerobic benzoate catabolism transcriptional regulator
MTRKQLAGASGTSERYLAQIEAGTGNPSVSVLLTLSQALDLAPAELLPQGGERSSSHTSAVQALRRLPIADLPKLLKWMEQEGGDKNRKGRRIALIGLRGAGKTSLGQALAGRLAMPFFEISKEVERAYGADIGLLLEINGQAALRRYEAAAWEAICEAHEAAVVAVPGGIVADVSLYERLLASAHSIWLAARPEDHMARVMAQGDFRPMASNRSAMADLKAILKARSPEYARANFRLDTSAQDFAATLVALEHVARGFLGDA